MKGRFESTGRADELTVQIGDFLRAFEDSKIINVSVEVEKDESFKVLGFRGDLPAPPSSETSGGDENK